jgi:putative hydrolase
MSDPMQRLLDDMLRMMGSSAGGGTPWLDAARSLAQSVATDGAPEGNPDPLRRIEIEELARVAELHVADATALAVGSGDHPVRFEPVGRGAWAVRALDSWRPWLEKMAAAQAAAPAEPTLLPDGDAGPRGLEDLLQRFASTMGPALLGLQFGSAAGHLAQHALGHYALPIPRPDSDGLLVIPANIDRFAEDWSLPRDQVQLWVCIRELTAHAVLSLPHVAGRIGELLEAVVADSAGAQSDLVGRLTGESADPEFLQGLLSDPESLLADLLTPGQRRTSAQLVAATTALGGYVDHVTARVAVTLIGSSAALGEAWYRHRTADATGEVAAGALLGLDLGREQVDRGAAFVKGVVERAGEAGLARLWTSADTLPTPAEIDAPGLWLERIDLPQP